MSSSLAPTAPTGATRADASFAKGGAQLEVEPTVLTYNSCFPFPQSGGITVITTFAGTVTVTGTGPTCSVSSASQEVSAFPGGGGSKAAYFPVTILGWPGCALTFTDKRGNTRTVTSVDTVTGTDCL